MGNLVEIANDAAKPLIVGAGLSTLFFGVAKTFLTTEKRTTKQGQLLLTRLWYLSLIGLTAGVFCYVATLYAPSRKITDEKIQKPVGNDAGVTNTVNGNVNGWIQQSGGDIKTIIP